MVKKVLESKLISIPETKEILDQVYRRIEESNNIHPDPFLEATIEYCHNYSKMNAESARKIQKMLTKDYNMDLSTAIQIVNIDPNWPQELKVILEKDPTLKDLSEEELIIMIQKVKDLQ